MLFHYDGNVDGWRDLEWSKKAIHIVAHNQTKCTANIISLPIPLFHDKGLPYCRKRRRYWLLCWLWASFMIGRALTSVAWGLVADRYGRKPVIIIGTFTVVIFNTLFGLSVNYWMAICTRFLLGSFNGLLGPIKAYACEIFNKEYQALGLSTVSTGWGIGLIIGPALGGFLTQSFSYG